jgi:hypothetical protein
MSKSSLTFLLALVAHFFGFTSSAFAAIDLKGYDGRPTANLAYFFDVQQTSARWGEVIGIKFAVINTGTTASGSFSVRLYFSKNTTFGDADDVVFTTVPGWSVWVRISSPAIAPMRMSVYPRPTHTVTPARFSTLA